jgi:hypothetical protein
MTYPYATGVQILDMYDVTLRQIRVKILDKP